MNPCADEIAVPGSSPPPPPPPRLSHPLPEPPPAERPAVAAQPTPSAEFALVEIPLDGFAGEAVNLRFFAEWAVEDYWIDIDNVNILGCPPTFGIYSTITEETSPGVENGN